MHAAAGRLAFPGPHLHAIVTALLPELRIKRLEVHDLNFEFVFPLRIRHDGSGEKDFETLHRNFVFHVERECPRSFPQK